MGKLLFPLVFLSPSHKNCYHHSIGALGTNLISELNSG